MHKKNHLHAASKSIISGAIAMIMILTLFLLLTGCNGGASTEGTDEVTSESTASSEPEGSETDSTTEGPDPYDLSNFRIIRPDRETNHSDYINMIKEKLNETEHPIEAGTDWIKDLSQKDSQGCEILIGKTNREASQKVMKELRYYDYTVRRDGDKIVIFSYSDEGLRSATEWFISSIVVKDGVPTFEGEHTVISDSYKVQNMTILGVNVSEFSVLRSKTASTFERNFAESLADAVTKYTGYVPKIVTDTESGGHYLSVARDYKLETGKYRIEVKDGSLELVSNSQTGFSALISRVHSEFSAGSSIEITQKIEGEGSYRDSGNSSLKGEAEIRIMSSNVLFDDSLDTAKRMNYLADTYYEYMSDIICLQEARANQLKALSPLISEDYAAVKLSASDSKQIYQQIFYVKDKYRVIDSGFSRFRNNVVPWGVSYAVFERISDGKQFAVTNTHLTVMANTYDPGKNDKTDGVLYRQENCKTVLSIIDRIREKYPKIPIASCGDWNSNPEGDSLKPMASSPLMKVSLDKALIFANRTNTGHTIGQMPTDKGDKIKDLIYISEDSVTVWWSDVVVNEKVINASDHCPVFADISFN